MSMLHPRLLVQNVYNVYDARKLNNKEIQLIIGKNENGNFDENNFLYFVLVLLLSWIYLTILSHGIILAGDLSQPFEYMR